MGSSEINNYMFNFNKAIEEQLRILTKAPRRRTKNKNTSLPIQPKTEDSSYRQIRITTGTGAGEGSGV